MRSPGLRWLVCIEGGQLGDDIESVAAGLATRQ